MLYPSVDSLKEKIDSKYTLVTLASKRAREMQETREVLLDYYRSHKNVGKALEEVAAGVLSIQAQDDSIVYEDEV
ncbi:DNA-directed RNA polymerase subunit omega [Sporosarcina sp. NCCP-2222]|uniref:DNA-directed RNA polymerase subunit omega n=1 Tax=Sporosarcina TaxID=1569 RepID=UPI001EDD3B57|nr:MULTISPECIES: DNA-directed RNA polymerase subunit omega [Sporosarcina]MCG3090157.1 DNA-directed RNA polymerase subunit omega [Sporosarcina cyprini]GKV55644.1 DNA-directed RNA polymerase subunit omega [Sporosarcina sp. NCCP-2222]